MSHNPLTYQDSRLKKSYVWDKPLTTVQWAEKNVRLNSDTSPITGMLDMKYTPHVEEMLNDYDKVGNWLFVGVYSTQTSKTTMMFIAMANTLDTKPCKMQFVIPLESGVDTYIGDKVEPFIRGVGSLNDKVEDYKQREKQRLKKTRIKVAGGDTVFTGTSASSKRSKTVKKLFLDECDLYGDGDVIELIGRTKSFEQFGRKVVAVSSQAKANGEISKIAKTCDIHKEWHTVCKVCNHHWYAGSNHLKWLTIKEYKENILEGDFEHHNYRTEALKDVYVECPECEHHITTQEKNASILNKSYNFHITRGDITIGKSFAYYGNALAMYFTSFETIASLIIDAEQNGVVDDMSQIYLDYFNEIYKPHVESVNKGDILLLGNNLPYLTPPIDTVRLYMSVDTQKQGFWCTVTAFTYGFTPHVIFRSKIETFDELEILLGRTYTDTNGVVYGIDKMLIDRMGIPQRTAEVDIWIHHLIYDLGLDGVVYPTIGVASDASGRLWYETTLTKDISTGGRKKVPIKAIKINNLLVKNELDALIQRSIKKAQGIEEYENTTNRLFYISQDIVNDELNAEKSISTDLSRQLTCEQYLFHINQKTGKVDTNQTWQPIGNRKDNHYFDCLVQAVTSATMDNVSLMQKPEVNDFEDALSALGL